MVQLKLSTLMFLLLMALPSLSLSPSSSAQTSPNSTTEVITGSSEKPKFSPFRPSMAVIVGALTTMFSITFLLLLYARHCKRGGGGGGADLYQSSYFSAAAAAGRKNSGVDRAVVESLPVFRFGALLGGDRGLEFAVCLSRFERSEVLRLLPKCRHAFHVECVDTWLDAHSTCPLCRFRIDPEDILLVLDAHQFHHHRQQSPDIETGLGFACNNNNFITFTEDDASTSANATTPAWFRRVSGRHSSAGERAFQLVDTASFRRSLDSWNWKQRFRYNNNNNNNNNSDNKRDSGSRKDGMLLSQRQARVRKTRLEHRIVVSSPCGLGGHHRWSDVQPSDLLYLRSEMIMSDVSRGLLFSSSEAAASGSRPTRQQLNGKRQEPCIGRGGGVISSRSVSEITGISRFSNDSNRVGNDSRHQAGLLSRWMAWAMSQRQQPPTAT